MVLLMPSPFKHPKTGVYWYRQRVPSSILPSLRGTVASVHVAGVKSTVRIGKEIKVSLRTKDPAEAKSRAKEAQAGFDVIWLSAEAAPVHLTLKQCVALSGEMYRVFKEALEDDPGMSASWLAIRRQAHNTAALADGPLDDLKIRRPLKSLSERLGTWVDGVLLQHNLKVDDDSYHRLLTQFDAAVVNVAELLERRGAGDYGPDTGEQRFPPIDLPHQLSPPAPPREEPTLSFGELIAHKQRTQSRKPRTLDLYRSCVDDLAKFIGHDDAYRVTKDDIRKWRDDLITRDLTTKTINDQYLSAVKSVLAHGEKEFDLKANVASGIRDERVDRTAPAPKGYDLPQAERLLAATFAGPLRPLSVPHERAVFWVPWIAAYTGLRVSEITQFQGRHLRWTAGVPTMIISPDDGSTKSGAAWAVAVHHHLIEMGLLDMIKAVGDGPIFYTPYPSGTDLQQVKHHRAADAANEVAAWAKGVLGGPAPGNRPNHAWRHTFTTLSRGRMDKEARDFMLGSRSVVDAREGYGDWPPSVLSVEINKLPRFKTIDTGWRPSLDRVAAEPPRSARLGRSSARS